MKENSGTISRFLFREGREWRRVLRRDYDLYLLLIPVIAFFVVFSYMPMYGLQIAFKDYSPSMTMGGRALRGAEASEALHQFLLF